MEMTGKCCSSSENKVVGTVAHFIFTILALSCGSKCMHYVVPVVAVAVFCDGSCGSCGIVVVGGGDIVVVNLVFVIFIINMIS